MRTYHIVSIRIALAGVRHTFVSIVIRRSWLLSSVWSELPRIFEVDFAFRNLVWIGSDFGFQAVLEAEGVLANNFVSLSEVRFISRLLLSVLVYELLSSVSDCALSPVVEVLALEIIRSISVTAFNLYL